MKRHAIEITATVLSSIALAATCVLLFYVTDLAPIQALLLAFVALLGALRCWARSLRCWRSCW